MSLFIGVEALTLSADDRRRLRHPHTAGVILFTRNYQSPEQLDALTREIRAAAPHLLIGVDHEGGRVQRFRDDFTALPPAATFGEIFDRTPLAACAFARAAGVIMAYELRRFAIDFSFAPVLDLRDEQSEIIRDRAFHANPAVVAVLSAALRHGLTQMGMAAVGKHYPGHGRVQGDSHRLLPVDKRDYAAREADRFPFIAAVQDGIEAIMSAHILLPEDDRPAGFSPHCLRELRDSGFDGAIISDDLDMAGAKYFPDAATRVQAALDAGADVAMICNTFSDMDTALAGKPQPRDPHAAARRLRALRARPLEPQQAVRDYAAARECFHAYGRSGIMPTP